MWGEEQDKAFREIKEGLSCEEVLARFDATRETVVSADASSYGLGAVLLQKQSSGELQSIAYISRAQTPKEQCYTQIEKEALGVTWACERFQDYLIGKRFHIETDHKPLVPLLSTKNLPIRIQQFRLRLIRVGSSVGVDCKLDHCLGATGCLAVVSQWLAGCLLPSPGKHTPRAGVPLLLVLAKKLVLLREYLL